MGDRRTDNLGKWKYDGVHPGMDLLNNPLGVRHPLLVESVGTDGRFRGAIRSFPGFGDVNIHGVPAPAPATTITSVSNIQFARYASIRKGTSTHVLKGVVYFADNQSGSGKSLYFAYRDSQTGFSDVVELEDFDSWDDFKPTTHAEFDITVLGRYVYFVNSGDTTSTIVALQDQALPYNKAYFWDFKINTWDKFVSGFADRFMSILPVRAMVVPLNEDRSGFANADDTMDTEAHGGWDDFPQGIYTYGVEMVSRKHGLRSHFRMRSQETTVLSPLRWQVNNIRLPDDQAGAKHQLKGNSNGLTAPIHWGPSHVDGFRLWRTPRNDTVLGAKYSPAMPLNLVTEYRELGSYTNTSALESWTVQHQPESESSATPPFNQNEPYIHDEALVSKPNFDPFFDEFGPAPRLKRLAGFDGMLVGVTDAEEPVDPDQDWKKAEQWPEAFVWSALHLDEPENFPTSNYWPLDDPAERALAIEVGASTGFVITNMGVYRIVRNGSSLTFIKSNHRSGGTSRFCGTVVGDTLYFVSQSGAKMVDGATGQVQALPILSRLVTDNKQWAQSLSSIHVEYDAFSGCIIFLNTTTKECVILWEATGAVTKLVDCPWVFLTAGPDVKTDGAQRALFLTSTGGVQSIDAYREMGKATMSGTNASETVNGTVTTESATNLIDSTANFPDRAVGFKVYILSGPRSGETADITAHNSPTDLSISGLSGTVEVGDRYSIAPVIGRLVFQNLVGDGDNDPFVTKITKAMSVAFSELSGETSSSDVNAEVTMGIKDDTVRLVTGTASLDRIPDKCMARVNARSVRAFPFLEFKGSNQDWELQSVLVHGQLSKSEAQSRQV